MNYRDQVKSYVSRLQRDFKEYVPKDFPLQFFYSNVSDESLYSMAMNLYTTVKNAKNSERETKKPSDEHPSKRMFHLSPKQVGGSVYFIDTFTGRCVMSMIKQPSGLYNYHGSEESMTIHGGRGMLGQLYKDAQDDDLLHDRHEKK